MLNGDSTKRRQSLMVFAGLTPVELAKQLKSWRADEGFRKIHFKQGLNRVLCRVENGWHGTQFSLVLALK